VFVLVLQTVSRCHNVLRLMYCSNIVFLLTANLK